MRGEPVYFELSLDSLRALGGWAADCAERVLAVFEKHAGTDPRPRAAIEGIRDFAAGGRRTAELRRLALAALKAGREAEDAGHPAAAAAARAAGMAASSAYTHPLADVQQTGHIVGPAAYAALAVELDADGSAEIASDLIRQAVESAPDEVREILSHMPPRGPGKSRLERLMVELDAGLRGRSFPKTAG